MSDPRQDIGTYPVVAGNPLDITVNFTVNGVGVDLTTVATAWASMLRRTAASSESVSFTVDASNAATGVLVLRLTADQTTSMATSSEKITRWEGDLQGTGGVLSPDTKFKLSVPVTRGDTRA